MAKRLIAVIVFVVPLAALLTHPELKRVLMWDLLVLSLMKPFKAAEKLQGKERLLAYEQLYHKTGEVWAGFSGCATQWTSFQ